MPITLQYGNITTAGRTAQTTTPNGNVFVSTTDPKIGNGSAQFGGATSILVDNANLKINNTTEKTIEFWVKDSTAPVKVYLSMGNFANSAATAWWQIYSQSSNRLEIGRSGAAIFTSAANTYFSNGAWNHFAWTTNGANNSWYVNGNLIGTFTRTAVDWNTSSNVMAIGAQNPTNAGVVGNMDELRISDIVRYTANFTPQTTAFTNDANTQLLLHMDGANASTSFPDDNLVTTQGGITLQYGSGGITLQYENVNPFWYDLTKEQVLSSISTWAPNATPTVTTFGTITGNEQFTSLVAATNGLMYAAPHNNTTGVLILNPSNNTFSVNSFGLSWSVSNKYLAGGALAPNGKIYFPPRATNNVLIIDPVANTATTTNFGLTFSGADQYSWCVLGRDGKIYSGGGSAPNILIIDPVANTATITAYGLAAINNATAFKWRGAKVSLSDNKIYCAPYNTNNWLVIDTTNQTATTTTFGLTIGGQQHQGITNTKDGKLIGSPANQPRWTITNPATNTGVEYAQNGGTIGITLGTDGKVYSSPFNGASNMRIYDPISNTVSLGSAASLGYWGGTMANNGKIYFVPWSGVTNILCLDTGGTGNTSTNLSDVILTCYLNGSV